MARQQRDDDEEERIGHKFQVYKLPETPFIEGIEESGDWNMTTRSKTEQFNDIQKLGEVHGAGYTLVWDPSILS